MGCQVRSCCSGTIPTLPEGYVVVPHGLMVVKIMNIHNILILFILIVLIILILILLIEDVWSF